MTAIKFNKFLGLRPKIHTDQNDESGTTAAQCLNVDLRKSVLSPLLQSSATNFLNPQAYGSKLFYNCITDTMLRGYPTDGLVLDAFRNLSLYYASFDGVAVIQDASGSSAPMFLPEPSEALLLTKSDGMADPVGMNPKPFIENAANSSVSLTQNLVAPPCIARIINTASSVSRFIEYDRVTVNAALERVLHTYVIQHNTLGEPPRTLYTALKNILTIIEQRAEIIRENSGNHPRHPYTETEATIKASLKAFITRLSIYVYRELTGVFPNNLVGNSPDAMMPCPDVYLDNELAVSPLIAVAFSDDANRPTYVQGTDITLLYDDGVFPQDTHSDLGDLFKLAADSYIPYNVDPLEAVKLVLDEAETCRSNLLAGGSYVWKGLDASATISGQALSPYTQGSDALYENTISGTYFVPRAYCFTYIDKFGRESIRSKYTTVDADATSHDINAPAMHTLRVFTRPVNKPYIDSIAIYRAIKPRESNVMPTWTRIAVVPLDDNEVSDIIIPVDSPPLFYNLTTDDRLPFNFAPLFMQSTASGYTVFTDSDQSTVYISRRNIPNAVPYNRQVSMPYGVSIVSIATVDDIIYVETNECPAFITIGEDKGELGADIQLYYLRHAVFPLVNANAIAATPWGVLYWSPQGLVMQVRNQVTLVSANLLDEDQVPAFSNVSHCTYHNGIFYSWVGDICSIFDIPDATFGEQPLAPLTQAIIPAEASVSTRGRLIIAPPASEGSVALHEAFKGNAMEMTYVTHTRLLNEPEIFTCLKVVGRQVSGTVIAYDGDKEKWRVTIVGTNKMVRVPAYRFFDSVILKFVGYAISISEITVADSVESLAD